MEYPSKIPGSEMATWPSFTHEPGPFFVINYVYANNYQLVTKWNCQHRNNEDALVKLSTLVITEIDKMSVFIAYRIIEDKIYDKTIKNFFLI